MLHGTIDIRRLVENLKTERIGRHLRLLDTVGSTNNVAWSALRSELDDGLVVLAEHQSAGRGRHGKVWHSPRGASLLCSVALVDPLSKLVGNQLSLLTAVAACEAVAARTELIPTIKWPNDLMIGAKKLGGILVEARKIGNATQAYVIGIGMNCLQQQGHFTGELASIATSLEIESCRPIDRTALAAALLHALDGWLRDPDSWSKEALHAAWSSRCPMIGQRLVVRHDGEVHRGSLIDVDATAELVIQLDCGGIRTFRADNTSVSMASTA